MDRFVWFVLLVVISHLVTEFTRATGYARGPRQDVAVVNDSLIQPIKVQNLVPYPGQEYGLYAQRSQQYYNGSNLYSNYASNNNKIFSIKNNNFLGRLFNQFANNSQNGQQQLQPSRSGSSNSNLNLPSDQGNARALNFRPILDSIFEIPISTLRAITNLLSRLTGGYLQPQQQLLPQQQPPKYSAYPSYQASAATKSIKKSAAAMQPKSQYEILNSIQPVTEAPKAVAAARQNATLLEQ